MMKSIKKFIKKQSFLYRPAIFFYDLWVAVRGIKINLYSIKEFIVKQRGLIDLGSVHYDFYANLFPRLLAKSTVDRPIIVLDVGGSDGWFAKVIWRFCGHEAKVISFEPLRFMTAKLSSLASQHPNYRFENVAVGAVSGETEITEYGTSGLSSIKGLDKKYIYSNYDTTIVNQYPVEVITIDEYLVDHSITNDLILKIDTQGFEYEVLLGAKQALASGQIKAVIVEVMTLEKYTQTKLYDEIFELLHSYGFKIFDLCLPYYENDGTLSEIDCAFIKR